MAISSLMMRKASLELLCYGSYGSVHNNGGAASPLSALPHCLALKCEEELDGYTEEAETRSSKYGLIGTEKSRADLQEESRDLIARFYRTYCGFTAGGTKHPAEPTLNRVVSDLLSKHSITYRGMVKRLMEQVNAVESVGVVLEQVFSDGVTNWGRIASMLALGAVVCECLKQECVGGQGEECVDAVAARISSYLSTQQWHWFLSNNGWEGFISFFHVHDVESVVRSTLIAVAGMAGLGACLIGLMR